MAISGYRCRNGIQITSCLMRINLAQVALQEGKPICIRNRRNEVTSLKTNKMVEEIAMLMHCTEKYALAVSDETIISRLSSVVDTEAVDRDGRTLLINAAFYGRTQVVEHLLSLGANVNAKDRNGFTALHAATQTGNLEITKLLLASNAEVNARNAFGNSPIMTCDHRAPLEIFKLLLKYGADPSQKNHYGISANECFAAYPDIIEILSQE